MEFPQVRVSTWMEALYFMKLWPLVEINTEIPHGGSPGNTYPNLLPLMPSNLLPMTPTG